MKICYMPPVAAAVIQPNVPDTANGFIIKSTDMGFFEEAFYNALNKMWADICIWFNAQWIKFVDVSFILCLAVAFVGAIAGIMGIKKGYQVTLISILFYLFLRLFSWGMGWY